MERQRHDTTADAVLGAYEAVVALATSAAPSGRLLAGSAGTAQVEVDLATEARRMRRAFQERAGAFGPEDPWFETRTRAFWDDALTTQGFARLAAPHVGGDLGRVALRFERAHRGLFLVDGFDDAGAHLVDLWSGVELLVGVLDDAQATTLAHAEGPMDARVVAGPAAPGALARLYVLPGALHHGPDAAAPLGKVLAAARERGLDTGDVLDALLRMERVLASSSRVKAAFAYRVESLPRAPA